MRDGGQLQEGHLRVYDLTQSRPGVTGTVHVSGAIPPNNGSSTATVLSKTLVLIDEIPVGAGLMDEHRRGRPYGLLLLVVHQ